MLYSKRNTYTKIGTIQRRLAWPLRKDDTQNREAFHIFENICEIMQNMENYFKTPKTLFEYNSMYIVTWTLQPRIYCLQTTAKNYLLKCMLIIKSRCLPIWRQHRFSPCLCGIYTYSNLIDVVFQTEYIY